MTVDEDVGNATLTVSLDVAGAADVTVGYATSNGTATAGSDYTAKSGTLTINAGSTSGTVSVTITDDPTDEDDEAFTFTLSSPTNASISDSSATVTITDNDPPPSLSVADVTVGEGAGSVTLTVSLSLASGKTVTVNYATSNGTATAGSDYTSKTGSLTFTPGQTSKTVSVAISDDPTDEDDETFTFTISGASNATIGDSSATVTITDNDPPPSMNVTGGGTVAEATGSVTLTVSLGLASGKTVTVDYATADGTATAPDDYTTRSGTLTFTPGQTSMTVSVPIISDTADEDAETFTFTLTNAGNATLGTASATITIGDNPALSVADVEVDEDAGNAVFTVSLDMAGSFQLTVDYATSDGAAKEPGDYTATSGTLTFTAGTTALDVEVPISDDSNQELAEDFAFTLSNPMNASISESSAEGLIHDNESPVAGRAVPSVFAVFEVQLSEVSGRDVSVDYATVDGTAIAGVNYLKRTGMLTIPAGERVGTIRVPIVDDGTDDANRSFSLRLSNPRNGGLRSAGAIAATTIRDGARVVAIGDATATEGGVASFPVTLSAPSDDAVVVDFITVGDSAVAGVDYVARRGRLTIPRGRTEGTIRVRVRDDRIDEPPETFGLRITGATNARWSSEPATGTILDDDSPPVLTVAAVTASEAAGAVEFTVVLSSPSAHPVSADFATLAGTATAGADYTATTGTVTIPPGWASVVVRVPILDDERDERDETFTLRLSNPRNVTLGDTAATATISDDDGLPSLAVADAAATEGAGAVTFTVRLSAASTSAVSVGYSTAGGTARSGVDFRRTAGRLVIPAGQTIAEIRVPVIADRHTEAAETFTLTLATPVGAVVPAGPATGTITPRPAVRVALAAASEGAGAVTFAVTLDAVSNLDISVDYATASGTATSGVDFTRTTGTLVIPAGETGAEIRVPVIADDRDEPAETFTLTLSAPVNAALAGAAALCPPPAPSSTTTACRGSPSPMRPRPRATEP